MNAAARGAVTQPTSPSGDSALALLSLPQQVRQVLRGGAADGPIEFCPVALRVPKSGIAGAGALR